MNRIKKVECVIMDWAGTAVDFGCFAPVDAFYKAFNEQEISLTIAEIRIPMGLSKREHIRQLLQMPRVHALFLEKQKRAWNEDDINQLNEAFEKHLFAELRNYTTPIPHVLETIGELRAQGIKIGSTTGYTSAMMEIVRPEAASKGYEVDSCITPDVVGAGRPAPFMIFQNMIALNVSHLDHVVKVGDTVEDIKEGVRANVWTVGVITGSSIMGLTEAEVDLLPENERKQRTDQISKNLLDAGADYVIDTLQELPMIIQTINNKL